MKSHVRKFALASAAAVAMVPAASFADGPKVYGKFNLAVEQVEADATVLNVTTSAEQWEVRSHASRFGVKGSVDLDGDLKAVYKMEWQVDVTDEKDTEDNHIKARNQYAGIKGGFGEVIVGRNDTPLKQSQKKADLFNDLDPGDFKNYMEGENREDNIIQYTSPKIADAVVVKIMAIPGEDAANGNDGIADATSFSIAYQGESLYLALAGDSDVDGADTSTSRVAVGYKADSFGVNGIVQTSEQGSGVGFDDEQATLVSAYYKAGSNKFKIQVGTTENASGVENVDADFFGIGVDHKLGKKTTVGVYHLNNEISTTGASTEETVTGVNLVHKF